MFLIFFVRTGAACAHVAFGSAFVMDAFHMEDFRFLILALYFLAFELDHLHGAHVRLADKKKEKASDEIEAE